MISGIYNFRRMEMVASFRFLEEGRFDFFFSYGAVDRMAHGTFITEQNILTLKSDKEPGKDFTIIGQSGNGGRIVIKVNEPNSYLAKYTCGIYFIDGQRHYVECNNNNEIIIEGNDTNAIYLQHQLFPDVPTLIKAGDNKNNNFEVRLNPSLQNISFKGIDFTILEDSISCPDNYIFQAGNMVFHKEKE